MNEIDKIKPSKKNLKEIPQDYIKKQLLKHDLDINQQNISKFFNFLQKSKISSKTLNSSKILYKNFVEFSQNLVQKEIRIHKHKLVNIIEIFYKETIKDNNFDLDELKNYFNQSGNENEIG